MLLRWTWSSIMPNIFHLSVADDGGDANGASDESRRVSRRKKTKVEYKEIDEKKDVRPAMLL